DLLEEVRRGEAKALSLTSQLEEARVAVAALRSSTSWRITRPMRMLKRLVCPAASGGGPLWSALRYIYHNLPIEAAHQNQLKDRAYRAFPSIFRHLRSYEIWSNRQRLFDQMAPAATQPESPIALKPIVPEDIFLATSSQPLVSVIIPVYGKIDYTLRCLYSLARNKPNAPFEVVVVDDKSPDDTLAMLSRVKGVRVAANEVNSGFIRSCNLGAAEARGDYLCFLNNDTEVMPGWLDELVGSFDGFSNVGLVGSKLVYPNGRLQEAGSIIWNDGSAWNFGRDQDPTSPEYNYAREVDYCSGASILLKKALFDELGGFDELYLPAYCEDDDLALKIRSRGMKVIYQPLSVVVHYEGVTSGTDTSSGAKAYQIENTQKLYGRWKDLLSSNQPPGIDVDKAKDRGVTQRALVLDSCTPTPDQDAGSNFTYNLLLSLRQAGIHTTFIPEDNFLYMPCYTPALQRAGIEVLYAPHVTSVRQHLSERGGRYDLVIIIRPVVAERCLDAVRQFCPKAKVVYHAADVHFLRMQREAELLGDPVKGEAARKMKDSELKLMASVDAVSVHSPVEQDLIRAHLPQIPVCLFRWVMPVRGTQSAYEKRRDIVFIGGYQHPPNVDAAVYFINEVLPLVKSVLPEVRFIAVGSNPPASLMALAANDVLVPGYVEDLASMLDGIRVAVAPLRYGAGIKGKIATTLSVGLPCVATSMAAEGMGLTNGEDILIADGPEALADAIVRLYREETLWRAVSEKGLIFAERTYGTGASETAIRNILETVGLKAPEGAFIRKLVSPTSFQNCTASPSSVCRDES
ncbi:MAG: glycosyltransferase, partial [Syntrophobacteraceae bacterium]